MPRMLPHRRPSLRKLAALGATFLLCGASECDQGLDPSSLKGSRVTLESIGDVSGVVRRADTQAPISAATVRIADRNTLTDASGMFSIQQVVTGSQTLSITAAGFVPFSRVIEVREGANAVGPFGLTSQTIEPEPEPPLSQKTVLILDRSNSMSVYDPDNALLGAAERYAEAFVDDDPTRLGYGAEIAVIGFSGTTQVVTTNELGSPGFTADMNTIRSGLAALTPTLANSNYDAALAAAFELIDAHASALTSTQRPETSYRVIFASDGTPFPDNCPGESNSPGASLVRVQNLADLATAHRVGLSFDTVLVVAPSLFAMTYGAAIAHCPEPLSEESVGWVLTQQLQAMADTGGGEMIFATHLPSLSLLNPAPNPGPVKVMFIVDDSGSMDVVDPTGAVVTAVQDAMLGIRQSSPFAAVSAMMMSAVIKSSPAYGSCLPFTPNVPPTLTRSDVGLSDHQGALNVATKLIRDDLERIEAGTVCESELPHAQARVSETRYVVVLISDGIPDPTCQPGFGNDPDANSPDGQNMLCEDQAFLDCLQQNPGYAAELCFAQPDASQGLFGQYPDLPSGLVAGGAYNQPWKLLSQVHDMLNLADQFSVGAIDFHTVFVDSSHVGAGDIEIYGLTNDGQLYSDMADAAGGTYLKASPAAISFAHIDFGPLN